MNSVDDTAVGPAPELPVYEGAVGEVETPVAKAVDVAVVFVPGSPVVDVLFSGAMGPAVLEAGVPVPVPVPKNPLPVGSRVVDVPFPYGAEAVE